MKKCIAFILSLLCLTVLIVSCTDNNGKDTDTGTGTVIVPVTDEQGETVTNEKGDVETEIKPAPADTDATETKEEVTTADKKFEVGPDNNEGWGPLTPIN